MKSIPKRSSREAQSDTSPRSVSKENIQSVIASQQEELDQDEFPKPFSKDCEECCGRHWAASFIFLISKRLTIEEVLLV